jgi:hypothetical protein
MRLEGSLLPVIILPTTPAVAFVSKCAARLPGDSLVLWREKSINPPMTIAMLSSSIKVMQGEMRHE